MGFLYPLENQGLIDSVESVINRNRKVFFPTDSIPGLFESFFDQRANSIEESGAKLLIQIPIQGYYLRSDKDKFELFEKIEPYLTFLDLTGLERKGADLQNRIEVMERENNDLRENMNKIMAMIQQNPKLAHVKPEVLVKKKEL